MTDQSPSGKSCLVIEGRRQYEMLKVVRKAYCARDHRLLKPDHIPCCAFINDESSRLFVSFRVKPMPVHRRPPSVSLSSDTPTMHLKGATYKNSHYSSAIATSQYLHVIEP